MLYNSQSTLTPHTIEALACAKYWIRYYCDTLNNCMVTMVSI